MANKYLEKIATVQNYRNYGRPVTDKQLAAGATSGRLLGKVISLSKAIPAGVPTVARVVGHVASGRSVQGIAREEIRGKATGIAKSFGYGLTAAAAGAGIGAIAGKFAGNRRVAKFGANVIGKATEAMGHNGRMFLDRVAKADPEKVKRILSHPHLGIRGGSVIGAGAGLAVGGVVGEHKGQYDGRLASIRNQIRDGSLKGVILTENKK